MTPRLIAEHIKAWTQKHPPHVVIQIDGIERHYEFEEQARDAIRNQLADTYGIRTATHVADTVINSIIGGAIFEAPQ